MKKKVNRLSTKNKKYKKNLKKSKKTKLFRKTRKLRGGTVKNINNNSNNSNNLINDSFPTRVNNKEYTFEIVNENGEVFEGTGIYSGMWQNNMPVGEGIMNFENSQFECLWKDGLPNGKGIVTWTNGNRYEGDLVNGNIQGKGIKYYSDGDIFQGTWKNGKLNGKDCSMILQQGSYKGECKDNMRNGYGIFENENTKYEGLWLNDKRYGKGKIITPTKIYDGNWVNDKPNGNGEIQFLKTDVVLKGQFNLCLLSGEEKMCINGIAFYPDESKFIGEFVNNEKVRGYADPSGKDNLANNDTYDIEYGFLADPNSITDSPFL